MGTARVESLDREGRGVAHLDGKAIFIEGALAGETVEYSSYRRKPTWELASATRIVVAAGTRVVPRCPHFGMCGGCALQHADFPTQIAAKQRVLEDAFAHVGKVAPETLLPPIQGPEWGYRHRARLSVRLVPKKGGVLVGFHERRSSYVADMRTCHVVPPHVAALLEPLRALIGRLSLADRLPQIEVAVGEETTVLVLRILQALTATDEALVRGFADDHRIQVWLQTKGPETAAPFHPLDAPPLYYALPEFGVKLFFRPTDFTQVNHAVNRMLVRRALRFVAPQPGERILDLFCGLGNFTLPLAASGADVIGIEGAPGLVERARANATANGLAAQFQAGDLFSEGLRLPQADKWLVDPPRDGAMEVMKSIGDDGPARIVYVSCDPATLARDAGLLVHTKGYRLRTAGIANMFPHTAHVESMAVFERA
jgi:23S rRNA (uracil1939-C5)-methyltransferase